MADPQQVSSSGFDPTKPSHAVGEGATFDPNQPSTVAAVSHQAPPEPSKDWGFFHSLAHVFGADHPIDAITGLFHAITSPIETVKAIGSQSSQAIKDARAAYQRGDTQGAVRAATGAIPLIGQNMQAAQDQVAAGNYAGAAGTTLGIVGPMAVGMPSVQKAAAGVLPTSATLPMFKNPNAITRAAVDWAKVNDIPIDAATATGNSFIRGVQYLSDKTLAGSRVAQKANAETAAALAGTGDRLAATVRPVGPISPEQAGAAARTGLESVIRGHNAAADTAYGDLRGMEADPANARTVQTGTRTAPPSSILGPNGQPLSSGSTTPVMEEMGMPVDIGRHKADLHRLYDSLTRQLPLTQRQASPALQAIGNLLEGPDYAPFSQVDKDLSALKSLVRNATSNDLRTTGQGLAADVVNRLERSLADAAAGTPGAPAALAAGRASTRAKYNTAETLDSLPQEPVRVFQQMTTPKDAAIDQLRAVVRDYPDAAPAAGRAWLDDLLTQATHGGGFDKAATIASRWDTMGPATKQALFGPVSGELDHFFTFAKRAGETPNPSGTAGVSSILGGITRLATTPIGYAVSKTLRAQPVVNFLSESRALPVSGAISPAARAALLAQMAAGLPRQPEPQQP